MTIKKPFQTNFLGEGTTAEDGPKPREIYEKGRFGELINGKFKYSLAESLYLLENNKIEVLDKHNLISKEEFLTKARRIDAHFWTKYVVFSSLRSKGYIVKTALKFGADFRVYDKGVQPGEDHAKWIVFPVHESNTLTWHDFSAKNRVSHSTRKNLLIAVVDDEDDVTYYEITWKKP